MINSGESKSIENFQDHLTLADEQDSTHSFWKNVLGNASFIFYMLLLSGAFHPNSDSGQSNSNFENALWLLVDFAIIIGLYVRRIKLVQLLRGSTLTVLFIAYLLLSATWSDDVGISFKRAVELLGTSASAYFVVCQYSYKTFLKKLAMAMTVVAFISAFYVLFIPVTGIMQVEYRGAWRGVFIHKNELGQAMVVAIVSIAIHMSWLKRFTQQWWKSACSMLLCFGMLVGSQSATSIGMMAALLAFVYKMRLSYSPKTAWIARGMTILTTLVIIILPFEWQNIFALFDRDTTLTGRTEIWGPVMHEISRRPWFGYGYDSFWLPDGTGSSHFEVPLTWTPSHAHNGMLELALDGGFFAIILFYVMYFRNIAKSWNLMQLKRDAAYAFPVVVCVYLLFANITEANIAKYGEINWALFICAVLYPITLRANEKHTQRPDVQALAHNMEQHRLN